MGDQGSMAGKNSKKKGAIKQKGFKPDREYVEKAVADFLKSGGKVEKLDIADSKPKKINIYVPKGVW